MVRLCLHENDELCINNQALQVDIAKLAVHVSNWSQGEWKSAHGSADGACRSPMQVNCVQQEFFQVNCSCTSVLVTALLCLARSHANGASRPDCMHGNSLVACSLEDDLGAALHSAFEVLTADLPLCEDIDRPQETLHQAVSSVLSCASDHLGQALLNALVACDTVLQMGEVWTANTANR